MYKIAVFASGRGSNFRAVLEAIEEKRLNAQVTHLIAGTPGAGCIDTAREYSITHSVMARAMYKTRAEFIANLLHVLEESGAGLIVLAGYMKKIPDEVLDRYQERIINIHPALLPLFGGKGMYGMHVHEAVIEAGCKVTGVTVHFVDREYDRGPIIAQQCVPVMPHDTPADLAARVLKTEHDMLWRVIGKFAEGRVNVKDNRVTVE